MHNAALATRTSWLQSVAHDLVTAREQYVIRIKWIIDPTKLCVCVCACVCVCVCVRARAHACQQGSIGVCERRGMGAARGDRRVMPTSP